ncbi:MAG: MXAN_6640 family putative metalloprotease [Actinomycetota bacterium]
MRARREIGISLLLGAALLGTVGAAAASAAPPRATISQATAARALRRVELLLDGRHRAQRPRELTTTLLRLARDLPRLAPGQRAEAKALLARPTDADDPGGSSYSVPEQPPYCTAHFCVHYVATSADAPSLFDGDGSTIPDYVELVAGTAEFSFNVENGTLGWQPAKPDGTKGGDARTDIYLNELRGELFGYASPDPGQGTNRSQFAYLVLDNDYSADEFPGTVAVEVLEVTFAHEYNHILQFGYDVLQDIWFYETSAVWMEDQVYGGIDDYFRYVKRWVKRTKLPLTRDDIKIYGSAVLDHWLAGRYGAAVIRTAWERAQEVKPTGFSLHALASAILSAGGSPLPREFARFVAATAEWRTPGVFPYSDGALYPDVKRRGKLHPGQFIKRRLSHLSYLLLRVRPRHVKRMKLLAGVRRGTDAAFALVCREGLVSQGKVTVKLKFAKNGGIRAVRLRKPGRCNRITAILINADPRQSGFLFGDWIYRHDHEPFAATLVLNR